jgi:hypothetical protein
MQAENAVRTNNNGQLGRTVFAKEQQEGEDVERVTACLRSLVTAIRPVYKYISGGCVISVPPKGPVLSVAPACRGGSRRDYPWKKLARVEPLPPNHMSLNALCSSPSTATGSASHSSTS